MSTMHSNDIKRISYLIRLLCAWLIAGLAGAYAQAPVERPAKPPLTDFGQKAIRRMISGNGFVVHAFGFQPFVRPAITSDSWLGGSGNWNAATSWSLGTVPTSSNDALITTASSTVQLNVAGSINNLTIGSTDNLNINNANSLTIGGTTITNSNTTGGITFGATNSNTNLIIGSSDVTLTGGGTVTLGNNSSNRIYGAVAADVLTNFNNVILGSGNIGAGQMALVNQAAGIIDANQTTPLYIQTSNGTTNTGTLEATAGGSLILDGDTYTNTNGTILASGSGSLVTLQNPTINGGTLNAATGASIQATGNPTLNGVTITTTGTGAYVVPNAQSTTIEGTITNSGAIQLNATNSNTSLILGGASVTLTGAGTVTMGNNSSNRIYGLAGTDVLTNASTIQGSGDIGIGQMGLINQGIIDANQATPLYIQTSAGTTNSATLEATAGGTLILDGDTYTNTGTILAGTSSAVTLQSPTINGGTLQTLLGGVISASGNPTLNGVTNTGTGSYQVPNAQQTTLVGTITNSGAIQLNATNSNTILWESGAVTLTGGGTVTLSDDTSNILAPSVANSSLTNVNNTISGSGDIGNGSLAFTNDAAGVVDATSTHSNALTIQTGASGATNLGLMEASSGGTLQLENAIANTNGTTNGTIEALNGGTVLLNGATVSGGTITTAGTGVVIAQGSSELNGSTNAVTNGGNLQVPNAQTLYMTGTLNNNGTLSLNASNSNTELQVNSATATLKGSGTVTFSDNDSNYIFATTGGNQLTIQQPISGPGGVIGNGSLIIVNQSTIDATASTHGNVLTIDSDGTLTNTGGTLEATGGGSLSLYGGTITNTGGNIIAGSGSTVSLNGSVDIVGGTLSGAGTFVGNSGAQLDGSTHTVTLDGNLQIPNANTFYIMGTVINNGTLSVNATNSNTELQIDSPTATLQGTGSITFTDNDSNYIFATTGGNQLTIAQPITGAGGNIGNGSLVLVNQSTIDATASAHNNTLTIDPDATFSNTGLLEATGGGSLALDGGTFTNTGSGTITAGSGSNVTLEGSVTVTGGTLNGAGLFTALNGSTLNGLTNAGTLQVPNANSSTLEGTIANTGALQLNATNSNTFFYASGAVTLTGGGTLTFSDNNSNYFLEASGGSSLTNVNNTISGSGNIGNGSMAFTNESAGVVDATSAHANSLTINSGTSVATNTGLIEASSGGTLIIEGTVTNTGGTIEGLAGSGASAGGTVTIDGAAITGGTLNTLGTGVNASSMTFYGGAILSGITNLGTIALPNAQSADIAGTITNNGSIQVNATNSNTFLYVNGNTTLNGTGTVVLSNNTSNYIYGSAGTEVLTNNSNTIEGGGHIGNGNLGLVNNAGGTVLANQPAELFIIPNSSGVTNNGTFQVNTGSTLDVTGGPFNNFNSTTGTLTGGIYNVNGGTFQFDNANIVTNAADIILTGASSQIISNTSANALANFATNAAGGTFQLGAGRSFTTSAPGGGNFTNDGTLIVGGGDTFKVAGALSNFSGTTLTGGAYYVAGTLQFGASGSSLITNDANLTLAGSSPQLIDLGGNNLLTGFNTNASGGTFTVAAGGSYTTPGSFINSGTMDLEQASTLKVSGNLTNSGAVDTNNQNLGGGANTLTVTGTLTNNTGATVTIGANNDTADKANVGLLANSGTVTVDAGATLNLTGSATDTNSGAVMVSGGTLNAQAGSVNNSGSMDEEKAGTITVAGNLTNNGTLTTNNANLGGGANTLTVSGTLTNNSGHSVTIGAHGDTTDKANVGLLANSGTVTVDTGATLNLTSAGADTNAGSVALVGGTLDMQAGSFTNSGTMDLEKKGTLTVTGNLTNSGTLTTNNANEGGAANTITVTGTLTNNSGHSVTIGVNNDTTDTASVGLLSNAGTVTVDKGATLKLTATGADSNTGSIALNGGTMSVASGGAFTNSSTLDAESGGKLTVGGNITNAGTLTTNNTNQGGAANTITVSGKLTNNDTTDKATLGTLANSGTVNVDTGASLTLSTAATDTNAGTVAVSGTLDIKAATTLSGAGTITLTNGAITGLTGGPALTNATTIQGAGTISNLGITNSGSLLANQSSPLIILPTAAGLNNTGTLGVSTGDTMQIGTSAGGALLNFSGTTLTGGTYNVGGTLQFGASGATLATNAATIALTGTGAKIINFGSTNILAGFKNNGATGSFTLAGGAALTTTAGTFTNAGLFTVSTGSTFTIGGSTFNYTQTGGTTTVDGTLTSSTVGTVSVNGGTLLGAGTVTDNVSDAGILSPGDSATKTGKLTVSDAYSQSSAGALDIAIDGATVGTKYDQLKVTNAATLGGTLNITVAAGFTPTVGETFTILTASSVTNHFATVNGIVINSNEYFTVTYNATSVVLKATSGQPPAQVTTAAAPSLQPALLAPITHSGVNGHYGPTVTSRRIAQLPALAPAFNTVTATPVSMMRPGMFSAGVIRGFRPMDESPVATGLSDPSSPAGSSVSTFGTAPVSAAAYNSMGAMNHMRFECGVDLKALLKTSRKQLLKGLWASPDSPNALSIGYMTYTGSH
jgi:hypothetical protein